MKKLMCVFCILLMGACFVASAQENPVVDLAELAQKEASELVNYIANLSEADLVNVVKAATDGDDLVLGNKVVAATNSRLNAMTDIDARDALARNVIDASLYVIPGVWTKEEVCLLFVKRFFEDHSKIIDLGALVLANEDDDPNPPKPISTRAYK